MKQEHTGPLHLSPARTLINVKGANGEQICQLRMRDKAYATLFAAAPELLEALKDIASTNQRMVDFRGPMDTIKYVVGHAKAAIAKVNPSGVASGR